MKTMCKVSFATALAAGLLLAQGDKPLAPAAEPEYFRLDFVVKEVQDGKAINSRSYSTVALATNKEGFRIRAGSKVPVVTGYSTGLVGSGQTPQIQYMDVGVNIDGNSVQRLQNRLTLNVGADLSTVVPQQNKESPLGAQIRQNRWNSPVIVPIGKPTVLFSSDDLASTRTLQLEVTATPVR